MVQASYVGKSACAVVTRNSTLGCILQGAQVGTWSVSLWQICLSVVDLCQRQGLFQRVSALHHVAKVLERCVTQCFRISRISATVFSESVCELEISVQVVFSASHLVSLDFRMM